MNDDRWWERYILRYATGSVIGAFIFYSLCVESPEVFGRLLVFNLQDLNVSKLNEQLRSLSELKIVLLGIYGLIFCYISSAPILVLHSSRMFIKIEDTSWRKFFTGSNFAGYLKKLPFLVIAILITGFISLMTISEFDLLRENWGWILGLFFSVCLVMLQFLLVMKSLMRKSFTFDFYEKLATNRSNNKTDLVNSYRHLREHGNAFGIILLELFLGMMLFAMLKIGIKDMFLYGLALAFWIFPASLVWLTGTAIESGLAKKN